MRAAGAKGKNLRWFSTSLIRPETLVKTLTTKPKTKPVLDENLKFGHVFSDHMLTIEWSKKHGWAAPHIRPHGPLSIDPAASSLHYALEGFEGMKAYKDKESHVRLFRPDMNMRRLNTTAAKLSLPTVNGEGLQECIAELIRLDQSWVPAKRDYSLYIRPTLISTQPTLGVSAPNHALLFVLTCPVGPYYPAGFKAVNLLADERFVRAWPGGTGAVKCGGNYGLTIAPQALAMSHGFDQLLWLFGPEHNVTEVGTMNQFFFWYDESGQKELITCPLDGTILPGVTRDSILAITRGWGEFKVTERPYTIHEVIKAVNEGRMIESFGAGTAALVCPVRTITFRDKTYNIPLDPNSNVDAGPLTQRLLKTVMDIQYGVVEHPWSVVIS
eukprot:c21270_g1_i1.p1 GENE.c21270_g1_i1~~c21270_g1_i1.p1  ORF type:complete len:385 (+),score=66.07 c21270_g1_i1:35-1189(+)